MFDFIKRWNRPFAKLDRLSKQDLYSLDCKIKTPYNIVDYNLTIQRILKETSTRDDILIGVKTIQVKDWFKIDDRLILRVDEYFKDFLSLYRELDKKISSIDVSIPEGLRDKNIKTQYLENMKDILNTIQANTL